MAHEDVQMARKNVRSRSKRAVQFLASKGFSARQQTLQGALFISRAERSEALRRLIEIALTTKSKGQSNHGEK